MMITEILGGDWEGVDRFAGVGLGIGKVEREFSAEIYIDGNDIQGTGKDESGSFRFEGRIDKFEKIYDKKWCDQIMYSGKMEKKQIKGSYR